MLNRAIYDFIKVKIASTEYMPGSTLLKSGFPSVLGYPKDMASEAFISLEQDKLIQVASPSEATVVKLDANTIAEAIFIIKSIISAIISVYSPVENEKLISALKDRICLLKNNISTDEFFNLDNQFYLTLSQLAGFPGVTDILFKERLHIERVLRLSFRAKSGYQTLVSVYMKVLLGMESNQPAVALMAVTDMVCILEQHAAMAKNNYPEFFQCDSLRQGLAKTASC